MDLKQLILKSHLSDCLSQHNHFENLQNWVHGSDIHYIDGGGVEDHHFSFQNPIYKGIKKPRRSKLRKWKREWSSSFVALWDSFLGVWINRMLLTNTRKEKRKEMKNQERTKAKLKIKQLPKFKITSRYQNQIITYTWKYLTHEASCGKDSKNSRKPQWEITSVALKHLHLHLHHL